MLDEHAMRACGSCGSDWPSPHSRANHERRAHPDWQPSPELRRARRSTKNATWKASKPRSWRFLRAANAAAKEYGRAPIDINTPLPDGPCSYCGGEAETWDHVVALGSGGPHTVENLTPSCHRCNRTKNRYPASTLDTPTISTVPCAVCAKPVQRKRSEIHRTRYVVCSPEHQRIAASRRTGRIQAELAR